MRQGDITYLEGQLDTFIDAAIMRVSDSGEMEHRFRISAAELKEATERQRLQETIVEEVTDFFRGAGASAKYDEARAVFSVTVDLNRVALNSRQAGGLSTAMRYYREEVGA